MYTIGIEEKFNVGTSAPLTVILHLDSRLSPEDIAVADHHVSLNRRKDVNAKYFLCLKLTGETNEGEQIDLTMSRCDKCKQRMKSKNKDEPESPRFCDVMTNKIQQTRKREGSSRDAIQIHFRCTPVKCHKLKSFVTLEIVLIDSNGNTVSKPNQIAKMHFRTVSFTGTF